MNYLKSFRLWFTLFALFVCIFNFLGYDDKNLLLFITSPPLMTLEDYSPLIRTYIPWEMVNLLFWYVLSIMFWFLFGWVVDWLIEKRFRKTG